MPIEKKYRTMSSVVKELMESKRLEIAILNWQYDKDLMRSILTELALGVFEATKSSLIKMLKNNYSNGFMSEDGNRVRGKGLPKEDLLALLHNKITPDNLHNLQVFWGMTPYEQELYMNDPRGLLAPEDRERLVKRVKNRFHIKE